MKNVHGCLEPNMKTRGANKSGTVKTELKKKRICLKCGKKFLSKGPYNRLCEKCGVIY